MDHTRHIRTGNSVTTDGRSIVGMALFFDKPNRVTDDGWKSDYVESFARGCLTKHLTEKGRLPRPIGEMHPWFPGQDEDNARQDPLGFVRFRLVNDGAEFEGRLDNSARSDEVLGKIRAGEWGDVSVWFDDYNTVKTPEGIYVRKEISLEELSIAPNGSGLHEGARIQGIRAVLPRRRPHYEALRASKLRGWL